MGVKRGTDCTPVSFNLSGFKSLQLADCPAIRMSQEANVILGNQLLHRRRQQPVLTFKRLKINHHKHLLAKGFYSQRLFSGFMVKFNASMQVLSRKDQKPILKLIKANWGVDFEAVKGFGNVASSELVMLLSLKEKIYLGVRGMENAPLKELRINSIGCYFGEYKGGDLRLSIEGAQIIGPHANKNIVELDAAETGQWMRGETIIKETNLSGFVLIKHGNDFIGCGKVTGDGRILNFVPKTRRITASSLPGTISE